MAGGNRKGALPRPDAFSALSGEVQLLAACRPGTARRRVVFPWPCLLARCPRTVAEHQLATLERGATSSSPDLGNCAFIARNRLCLSVRRAAATAVGTCDLPISA